MAANNKKKTGKPNSFTFYDGFSEAVEMLPKNSQKAAFVFDIYQYGAWGIEPTFSWAAGDPALTMAVQMAWSIAQPSLDKSVRSTRNGKKGGRPKKNADPAPTISPAKYDRLLSEAENDIADELVDALADTYIPDYVDF